MTPMQRVLEAAGPQAAHIEKLWWITVAICTVVFVAIMIGWLWALRRAPRASEQTLPELVASPASESRTRRVVISAVALSALGLIVLLVASVQTDRALAKLPLEGAIGIRVVGHQWWWDVYYDDPDPLKTFSTANEIYIPVGKPVVITLQAADVIHSLWIPNLHGKRDLIPGHTLTLPIKADKPGKYRAQCAEFCGLQHAFMALTVNAVPQADYDRWHDAQLKPPAEPDGGAQKRGHDLFLSGDCMMCHAVQGTTANAHFGPDLTHVASRETLGAGRLANTPENLAAWIADPGKFKPGVNMPPHRVAKDDLDALVAYLGTLK